MGRKFYMKNGVKVYLKEVPADAEVKDEDEVPAPAEAVPAEGAELTPEEEQKAVAMGQAMAKAFNASAQPSREVEAHVPQASKGIMARIAEIVSSKDFSRVDSLSKSEKIVGFYQACVTKNEPMLKALTEGTAANGGYLVPDEFRAEVIAALAEFTPLRNAVTTIPMRRDVMKIPAATNLPNVYWTAEAAAKTTATALFAEVTLTAYKLAAIMYASDELVEDSTEIDVVQWIIKMFARAIGVKIEQGIAAGTGTAQITGLNAATIASIAAGGNLTADKLVELYYTLPAQYRSTATWVSSRANLIEIRKLKDTTNQYIWQPGLQEGVPDRLLGRPVIETDWIGEATIYFGDLKQAYYLGDRKEMTVKITQDSESAFTKDLTGIRVVQRLAGNVVLADAIRKITTIP